MRLHPQAHRSRARSGSSGCWRRSASRSTKLPPVVHVAGTNGKGSMVAYLRAMSEAAGYRVHVYTSPHLVRFNERIRVAGELIERRRARRRADRVRARPMPAQPITFFEITTAAAFLAFARVAGRPRPARGRARRPARRHQRDRPSGAHARSRRSARPHELSRRHAGRHRRREGRHPEARRAGGDRPPARSDADVIAARGRRARARRCSAWDANGRSSRPPSGFRYDSDLLGLDLPAPALAGAHQLDNAATAVACIERLRAAKFASTMRR